MSEVSDAVSKSDLNNSPNIEIGELNLTVHSVLEHFIMSTKGNVALLSFLQKLNGEDKWAVDFNEEESPNSLEIQGFILELQKFVENSLPVLHEVPREFSDMLSYLTTAKCLYLMRFVGQHNDKFLDEIGVVLEQDNNQSPNLAAIRRRLETFSRAGLLSEIFSGKRLTRILRVMGSYADV